MDLQPMDSYKTDRVNPGLSKAAIGLIRFMNCLTASDFNEQYYNWMNHHIPATEKLRWLLVRMLKKAEAAKIWRLNKKLTDEKTERKFS